MFLLYCLLEESPDCDDDEQARQSANLEAIVTRGREPGLMLDTAAGPRRFDELGAELLDRMASIAALLDRAHDQTGYSGALAEQRQKIADPELTPSARVLREMREQDVPFFRLAMNYSEEWATHFRRRSLSPETQSEFDAETRRSLSAQTDLEQDQGTSFEEYLQTFYDQYKAL